MEEDTVGAPTELADAYVALEEEGHDCGILEGMENPMVLVDNEKDEIHVDLEFPQYLSGGVLEPTLGMEFGSEDDSRNFYNAYAKQTGFSVRVNSYYRSKKDNSIISREFCCSKEGFRRDKRSRNMDSGEETKRRRARSITREGCKALMTVRRRNNGKWYVAKLEKTHNHELVTPEMRHFLRSHKEEQHCQNKGLSTTSFSSSGMEVNNVSTEECNSFGKMVFSNVNYVGRGRLSNFGIDGQSLLAFFKVMQVSDPAFYYAIQVDEDDRLSSVFWVDTRSRIAYNCFSDVVTFDTTYQVNQYKMPFAPFTGVNHHRQSVLFGCALLADETESTFVWLFTTWLDAMLGRQPGLIITDYDSAITRAVQKVFTHSNHRYCKSHIVSRMPKEMGPTYSALPKTFHVEYDKCVNKSETVEEFEHTWELILEKYNLRENEWFQSVYIDRKLWVPLYVRDTFFASTQQSETVNSLFDGYVNARTTLEDFAEQYQKALDDRFEKEAKAEFETFYTKPILKTPLPMEKQAAEVYTRKMFLLVQEEIFESLVLAVKLSGDDGETRTHEVAKFDEEHRVYFVVLNISKQLASCSCKMFDFEGILCRHVMAVFKVSNVFLLPDHYVLTRWSKSAKDVEGSLDVVSCAETRGKPSRTTQYNVLYQEAVRCAEEGITSDQSFKVALIALREARAKVISAKKNGISSTLAVASGASYQDESTAHVGQVDSSNITTLSENLIAKSGESCLNNNDLSQYVLEQQQQQQHTSTSSGSFCGNCSCLGHESHACLWLKDSDQDGSLVRLVNEGDDAFIVEP